MRPYAEDFAGTFARQLRKEMTDAERRLWYHLRRRQMQAARFRRQVPIGRFIADFACLPLRLVIELDGGQHNEALAYDAARTVALQALGYRVLRFWNHDVMTNLASVLDTIWVALDEQRKIQRR